jgi:hypothetical protein
VPAIDEHAASTASTPASMAASSVPICPPAVSCVCRWTGRSKRSQGGDQGAPRVLEQAGHVLDRQDVGAGVDDLLGQTQVVVEGVELLAGVREVAGVAQGDLGDGRAGLEDGLDGGPHLADVVERVEDPEDVQARACRLVDEGVGHLRG